MLTIVGVLRIKRLCEAPELEVVIPSVNANSGIWHVAHEIFKLPDNIGSKKSFSPNNTPALVSGFRDGISIPSEKCDGILSLYGEFLFSSEQDMSIMNVTANMDNNCVRFVGIF